MRGAVKLLAAGAAMALVIPSVWAASGGPPTFLQPPAPTVSADEPGRIPYAAGAITGTNCEDGTNACGFDFPAVPTGKRLVIQQISGDINYGTQPNYARAFLTTAVATPGSPPIFFFLPVEHGLATEAHSSFVQPVQFYIDAGNKPAIGILINQGTLEFRNQQALTLTGYLIDCSTTNPCQPIAPPPATN